MLRRAKDLTSRLKRSVLGSRSGGCEPEIPARAGREEAEQPAPPAPDPAARPAPPLSPVAAVVAVGEVRLGPERDVRVRSAMVTLPAREVGTAGVAQPLGEIRAVDCELPATLRGAGCNLAGPALEVGSSLAVIAALPCIRRGAAPTAAEREEWVLRAARIIGLPPAESEVVAVFRDIPVERVESLAYEDDSGAIGYVFTAGATQATRLHGVAAVRDRRTRRVRVVVDPAYFRLVALG